MKTLKWQRSSRHVRQKCSRQNPCHPARFVLYAQDDVFAKAPLACRVLSLLDAVNWGGRYLFVRYIPLMYNDDIFKNWKSGSPCCVLVFCSCSSPRQEVDIKSQRQSVYAFIQFDDMTSACRAKALMNGQLIGRTYCKVSHLLNFAPSSPLCMLF